jgi:hypothetical protein
MPSERFRARDFLAAMPALAPEAEGGWQRLESTVTSSTPLTHLGCLSIVLGAVGAREVSEALDVAPSGRAWPRLHLKCIDKTIIA